MKRTKQSSSLHFRKTQEVLTLNLFYIPYTIHEEAPHYE